MHTNPLISHIARGLTATALILWAAGCSNDHADHDHDHEGHDHATEAPHDHDDHDHDHEGYDHDAHDHEGHGDEIKLSPDAAKRFGVKTRSLQPGEFHEAITVSGQIEPAASDQGVASAPRAGIVTISPGLTTGMKVTAGQRLATVSPKGLAGGDSQRAAIASRDAARAELSRLEPLYRDGVVSAKDYNEAKRQLAEAEANVGSAPAGAMAVTSPRTGTITQILVRQGEYVELGQPIAVTSATTRLTLRADVPERYHSMLPTVATANFRPDYSGRTLSLSNLNGRLAGSPGSSPSSNGYIPVYFSFDNDGSVVPGSFAEVILIGTPRHGALTIPSEAIMEIQGNKYVYTRIHDDAYSKHLVRTVRSDGSNVEIISGLEPGMEVVIAGAGVIRMAENSNVAPPGHSHNH